MLNKIKNNIFKISLFIYLFFTNFLKINAQIPGWTPIWKGAKCAKNNAPVGSCDICDALIVFQNIINNGFKLAIVIAVIMLAWGSIILIVSSGSENNIKKGKGIINNALIGLLLALFSWTIINLLLHFLTGHPDLPWYKVKC